jgi:hypothetical protein
MQYPRNFHIKFLDMQLPATALYRPNNKFSATGIPGDQEHRSVDSMLLIKQTDGDFPFTPHSEWFIYNYSQV